MRCSHQGALGVFSCDLIFTSKFIVLPDTSSAHSFCIADGSTKNQQLRQNGLFIVGEKPLSFYFHIPRMRLLPIANGPFWWHEELPISVRLAMCGHGIVQSRLLLSLVCSTGGIHAQTFIRRIHRNEVEQQTQSSDNSESITAVYDCHCSVVV